MDASKVQHTKEVEKLDTNENSPKNLEAQPGSQGLVDSEDPCNKVKSVDDVRSVETDGIRSKDSGSSNDGDDGVASRTKEDGISRTKSSSHEHSLSRIKDVCMDEVEDHSSAQSSDHHSDVYELGKAEIGVKDYGTKEKSNDEVDYDIVDPLEVARQVAIEVEREVGDRREQSCSSSDKALQKGSEHPDSPESSHETESRPQKELSEEAPLRFDLSAEGEETSPESLDHDEPKKGTLECSQLTEVAQGPPADAEKGQCGFDLNEEVSSEDVDQSDNPMSTHISIVSASRATAAPGLPNSPLQFEGSLGWKGSAATSAFRPASPRRIPEIDKVPSTGGSNSSSTQRDGCLDIDLNLDECILDETVEKQVRGSGLPSGESSLEVSTRVVSERVELDLNRGTDDSDAPSEWQTERDYYYYQPVSGSGYVGQCISSSSSSEQQHSLKHIDLNCPSSNSESPDHHHHHHPGIIKFSQNLNAPGVKNDKIITLFGIKIGDIPESSPHHHLINGRRIPDGTVDFNLSRNVGVGSGFLGFGSAAVTYSSQPSVYGYSGLTLGGSAVGLTSGVTAAGGGGGGALPPPIPPSYMLDSRGLAPVIHHHHNHHQITGSSTPGDIPPMFSQPSPPFLMSLPCPNGCVGLPPRTNNNNSFDLNSGGLFIEGVGGGGGGGGFILRPPPINNNNNNDHHHHHLQLRSSSSSGIIGTKRKEPELGWEPSSYPFRQHHPPPPTWR